MLYEQKKVFILKNKKYFEISYAEFCKKQHAEFKDKSFICLHGALMEVSKEFRDEFYQEKAHEEYIQKRSETKELYYSSLDTDEFCGEDIVVSLEEDICTQVLNKIMIEQLRQVIQKLSYEEKLLLNRHYKEEISETELAQIYGVSQQAISKRLVKIRKKLKILLKI